MNVQELIDRLYELNDPEAPVIIMGSGKDPDEVRTAQHDYFFTKNGHYVMYWSNDIKDAEERTGHKMFKGVTLWSE